MRAVGFQDPGDPEVLTDVEIDDPEPGPRDLLVEVRAVSVNPVDTKVRRRPKDPGIKVLGFDAVGVVRAVGADVSGFRPGERVWYAGTNTRPGTDAELHLVEERIAAHAPNSLDDADAAALPLTTITAWELLFDRLAVPRSPEGGSGQTLLVVGGAGGVGSILIQLARQLTDLTVIGTASRPETVDWVRAMGAHHVVDHHDLTSSLAEAGFDAIDLIAALTETERHLPDYLRLIAPQGKIAVIDDLPSLDIVPLKAKSVSVHWESMFTRSTYRTPDLGAQGELLTEVAALVDRGVLRSTRNQTIDVINADHLRAAHVQQESGTSIGKTVLVGWSET